MAGYSFTAICPGCNRDYSARMYPGGVGPPVCYQCSRMNPYQAPPPVVEPRKEWNHQAINLVFFYVTLPLMSAYIATIASAVVMPQLSIVQKVVSVTILALLLCGLIRLSRECYRASCSPRGLS